MLQTTRILVPLSILSLTVLGLAAIYGNGLVEVQWGTNKLIRIENTETDELQSGMNKSSHAQNLIMPTSEAIDNRAQ